MIEAIFRETHPMRCVAFRLIQATVRETWQMRLDPDNSQGKHSR